MWISDHLILPPDTISSSSSESRSVFDDEEVPPETCHRVLDPAADKGSPLTLVDYEDATHDFDDPGKKRQREPDNQDAREDVLRRAAEIFAK